MIEALFIAAWTWPCAWAIFARLTSSSRFCTSSSRRARSLFRPSLSLSASSVWPAACVSSVVGLALEADLAPEGDLGEVVELVRLGGVARRAERVCAARGGLGLAAPLVDGRAGLAGVVLDHPQVADRLGHGLLGLGDVVGEVPDELVEHLLGILGAVEERIDVRADELSDPAEDRRLSHG